MLGCANQENCRNWHEWRHRFYHDSQEPLRPEPVYREINRIAAPDALFVTDVGNVTIHSIRHLEMTGEQRLQRLAGLRQWVMVYLVGSQLN